MCVTGQNTGSPTSMGNFDLAGTIQKSIAAPTMNAGSKPTTAAPGVPGSRGAPSNVIDQIPAAYTPLPTASATPSPVAPTKPNPNPSDPSTWPDPGSQNYPAILNALMQALSGA